MNATPKTFAPREQRELAQELSWQMIDLMQRDGKLPGMVRLSSPLPTQDGVPEGGPVEVPLAEALKTLVRLTWPVARARGQEPIVNPAREKYREQLMQDLQKAPDTQDITIDVIAHAAQLHQISGLLARETLLHHYDKEVNPVKRFLAGKDVESEEGARSTQKPYTRAADAVEALSRPKFEMSLTSHPTNTNSIASMQAQRALAKVLLKMDRAEIPKALLAFATTSLLPENSEGHVAPLTPLDETNTMLYILGNSYEDLTETYGAFDKDLNTTYRDYHPETLKLGITFHSWGSSGDKDGNANVNADSTLYAAVTHRAEITKRYAADMKVLGLPEAETMAEAAEKFDTLRSKMLQTLAPRKDKIRKFGYLEEQEFDGFLAELKSYSQSINMPKLIGELEANYANPDLAPEKKQPTLDLLRRMRAFGMHFGHIEYRETAEEYTRVVARLIPGYAEMDEKERCDKIAALLQSPDELKTLSDALRAKLAEQPGKPYIPVPKEPAVDAEENAFPVAYQTLKRMEIARDLPDLVQNNVLAECKSTSNMLEAVLLQHAVAKDGVQPAVGVVPLFEDFDTLDAAPKIVGNALRNPAYAKHIDAVSASRGEPVSQQVQIAHSDNVKRAGMPAARALIYNTHFTMRDMFAEVNAERTGHNQAPIDLQFFEGGSQSDPYRGGMRAITATINEFGLHKFFKATFQGGDLPNYFNIPASACRLLTKNIVNSALRADQEPVLPNDYDRAVINVFRAAIPNYRELYEGNDYKEFLNHIGYPSTSAEGNLGSRSTARPGSAPGKLENIDKSRAIGLSKTLQHPRLGGTWIGSLPIDSIMEAQMGEKGRDPNYRKTLYKESPVYRDIIDRMMWGLMRTDLVFAAERSRDPETGEEHPLMDRFRKEYLVAYRLCVESYTGKSLEQFMPAPGMDLSNPDILKNPGMQDEFRQQMKSRIFPHAAAVITDQDRLLDMSDEMSKWDPNADPQTQYKRRVLLHTTNDTAHHGRITEIEDTIYGDLKCKFCRIGREFVDTARGMAA